MTNTLNELKQQCQSQINNNEAIKMLCKSIKEHNVEQTAVGNKETFKHKFSPDGRDTLQYLFRIDTFSKTSENRTIQIHHNIWIIK